jgi:hypothetical protein
MSKPGLVFKANDIIVNLIKANDTDIFWKELRLLTLTSRDHAKSLNNIRNLHLHIYLSVLSKAE